jgi:hypothetical protein
LQGVRDGLGEIVRAGGDERLFDHAPKKHEHGT